MTFILLIAIWSSFLFIWGGVDILISHKAGMNEDNIRHNLSILILISFIASGSWAIYFTI